MDSPPTTEPVIRVVAMPADTNPHGDIFGGWLMSLMDIGAGTVAMRVCKGRAVTVAMDGMQFHAPVAVGDEVSVYGTLLSTGRTSMTIAVEAWRRLRDEDQAQKVTEANFTFVAIDDEGRPRPVRDAKSINSLLSERLKIVRKQLGLTQEEFSERLGVTQGTVSRWEHGATPDIGQLNLISELSGVPISALIDPAGKIPPVAKSNLIQE